MQVIAFERYIPLKLSCARDFRSLKVYGDFVYKLQKIVGTYTFSGQFSKIISHYKKVVIIFMYCDRLHAWWSTQSRLVRGSFFMFVESGCISTNIEFTVP